MVTVASPTVWAAFIVVVLALLALDLGVFHRKAHEVRVREATLWSLVWISLSLAFGALIWRSYGRQIGLEFLTGYLIEWSLSVDNVFVWLVLFTSFTVPRQYQHRVLFWGVLGAVVLRGVFVAVGAAALARFEWMLYVFGAMLVITGAKLFWKSEEEPHIERSRWFRAFARAVPSTRDYRGQALFVRENHRLLATPLFFVLVAVELTDVMFAVDSVPAIFAVTRDPFVVWSSNVCAILGLRSMYFVLERAVGRLQYLRYGLGAVLVFVGVKMLIAHYVHIPTLASLTVVFGLIVGSALLSLWASRREAEKARGHSSAPE
ncbi:MAG TPA: TerC family protein [Candidatus Polarisedimenticolaceae bacterium]|nr:TerC family protein [Candidatus Polarisedimenticolaceae bacterium]